MRIEQKRGGKVYLYSLNKSEKSLEINENAIISSADYHLNRLTHSLHNIGFVSMNHFDSEWYSTFDQTTKKTFVRCYFRVSISLANVRLFTIHLLMFLMFIIQLISIFYFIRIFSIFVIN